MTDRQSIVMPNAYSDSYRHARRRWVPKGVLLLLVLFVLGLISAREDAGHTPPRAKIVVPAVSHSALAGTVKPALYEAGSGPFAAKRVNGNSPGSANRLSMF